MNYPQATPISQQRVYATPVPEYLKLQTLPRVFGRQFLAIETAVNHWMRLFCKEYTGGDWKFYDLSNGGFFMAPNEEKTWHAVWPINFFEGDLSSEAVGVLATLQALNTLAYRTQDDLLLGRLYQLQEYVQFHPERVFILAALD